MRLSHRIHHEPRLITIEEIVSSTKINHSSWSELYNYFGSVARDNRNCRLLSTIDQHSSFNSQREGQPTKYHRNIVKYQLLIQTYGCCVVLTAIKNSKYIHRPKNRIPIFIIVDTFSVRKMSMFNLGGSTAANNTGNAAT